MYVSNELVAELINERSEMLEHSIGTHRSIYLVPYIDWGEVLFN